MPGRSVTPPPPPAAAALASFAAKDETTRQAVRQLFLLALPVQSSPQPQKPSTVGLQGKRNGSGAPPQSVTALRKIALGQASDVRPSPGVHGKPSSARATSAGAAAASRKTQLTLLSAWRVAILCCPEDAPRDELEQVLVKCSHFIPPTATEEDVHAATMAPKLPTSAHLHMSEVQMSQVLLPWLVGRGAAAARDANNAFVHDGHAEAVPWRIARMSHCAVEVAREPSNAATDRILHVIVRHEVGLLRLFHMAMDISRDRDASAARLGVGSLNTSNASANSSEASARPSPPALGRIDRVSMSAWRSILKRLDVFPSIVSASAVREAFEFALVSPLLQVEFPARLRLGYSEPSEGEGEEDGLTQSPARGADDGASQTSGVHESQEVPYAADERLSPSRLRTTEQTGRVVQPPGLCFISFVEAILRLSTTLDDDRVEQSLRGVQDATGHSPSDAEASLAKLLYMLSWVNSSEMLPHSIFDVPKLQRPHVTAEAPRSNSVAVPAKHSTSNARAISKTRPAARHTPAEADAILGEQRRQLLLHQEQQRRKASGHEQKRVAGPSKSAGPLSSALQQRSLRGSKTSPPAPDSQLHAAQIDAHPAASAWAISEWPGLASRVRVSPSLLRSTGDASCVGTATALREAVSIAINGSGPACLPEHLGSVAALAAPHLHPQPWFQRHGATAQASPPSSPAASPERVDSLEARPVGLLAAHLTSGPPSVAGKNRREIPDSVASGLPPLLLDDPLANGMGAASTPPRFCALSGALVTLHGALSVSVSLPDDLKGGAAFKSVLKRLTLDAYACGPEDAAWRHLDLTLVGLQPPPASSSTPAGDAPRAADVHSAEEQPAPADAEPPITIVTLAFRASLRLPLMPPAEDSGFEDSDEEEFRDHGYLTAMRLRFQITRRDELRDATSSVKNPRTVVALRTFRDPRPVPLRLRLFRTDEDLRAFCAEPEVGPGRSDAHVALAAIRSRCLRESARAVAWEPVMEAGGKRNSSEAVRVQ